MVSQQLEQMATIGRCEYSKTCQVLVTLFDQTATSYQEILRNLSSAQPQQLPLREGVCNVQYSAPVSLPCRLSTALQVVLVMSYWY